LREKRHLLASLPVNTICRDGSYRVRLEAEQPASRTIARL
jgi:hypothetical protein